MQYKALPWLRVCTFGLGAQSANIWRRDWNVWNAIIEVQVLRNPRTLSHPPAHVQHFIPCPCTRPELLAFLKEYYFPTVIKGELLGYVIGFIDFAAL